MRQEIRDMRQKKMSKLNALFSYRNFSTSFDFDRITCIIFQSSDKITVAYPNVPSYGIFVFSVLFSVPILKNVI